MQYTDFGTTGVTVSRLGMGCMRFEKPDDIDAMAHVVTHAHASGITYFDTAPYYCEDKSEEILGHAVREMKKTGKPFYISTKCGSESGDEVRKSLEKSLTRLQVDAIDFFHCWCVLSPEKFRARQEKGAIDVMLKAQEEGLIRHVSISTHMPSDEMKKVFDTMPFASVLCGYNVLNYRLRDAGIAYAKERGMGVAVMNPLGGGLIPESADLLGYIRRYDDQPIVHAALDFIWSNPAIDVALVGLRSVADVDDTVAAMNAYTPPEPSWKEAIARHETPPENALCTQCGYCDVCPEKIPVFKYMDAYNYDILRSSKKEMYDRLKWHWGITTPEELERCSACGACENVCTQHLSIIARMEEMRAQWPAAKSK